MLINITCTASWTADMIEVPCYVILTSIDGTHPRRHMSWQMKI